MAATKTKPKSAPKTTSTKTSPKAKASPKAGKTKAAKASPSAAAAPKAPSKVIEVGSFATFKGYRSNVEADEVVFAEGDVIYIVEHSESEDGLLYAAIAAADVGEYLANGDENISGGEVAPSEVAEIKGAALERIKDQHMPITLIGQLEELLAENDNAIEVAIELNHGIQEKYFYLGGALAKILQEGSYLTENGGDYSGEDAFGDFCQSELGFKASKGRQLARMYQTFSQIPNFDPASLEAVGWSKAAIAERFVTDENVDEVLELAENVSQRELASELKTRFVSESGTTASGKVASRGATIAKTSLTFRLDEDSADTVKLAIDACKKQTGIMTDDLALEHICTQWAQDHVEVQSAQKRIMGKAKKAQANRKKAEEAKAPAADAKPKAPRKKAA